MLPFFFAMSSCHLLVGHPLDLFPPPGFHSVQGLVHLLSFIFAVCPAHFHFCVSMHSIESIIFVLFLTYEHDTLSCSITFNISSPLLFEQFSVCLFVC